MTNQTSLIPHLSVAEIARRYDGLGIPGTHPADQSRVIVGTLKAIAKGTPVTAATVSEIAANAGMAPSAAADLLAGITERNDAGDIIGLMGLSQNLGFDIKFTVTGQELRTWCALDSLFLPLLLDRKAVVESESALNEDPIRFTVGPDGVGKSDPSGVLVSLMLPSQDARQGISKVEDIWLVFCHQVRFFTSPGEIEEWVAARPGLEIAQLTLEETAELAAIAWADLRSYAR